MEKTSVSICRNSSLLSYRLQSGTLGISECVVRRLKALQHIYFLEVCIWRESWCLLGVLSNNKPQNENEQYTISFQQSPTISGL